MTGAESSRHNGPAVEGPSRAVTSRGCRGLCEDPRAGALLDPSRPTTSRTTRSTQHPLRLARPRRDRRVFLASRRARHRGRGAPDGAPQLVTNVQMFADQEPSASWIRQSALLPPAILLGLSSPVPPCECDWAAAPPEVHRRRSRPGSPGHPDGWRLTLPAAHLGTNHSIRCNVRRHSHPIQHQNVCCIH